MVLTLFLKNSSGMILQCSCYCLYNSLTLPYTLLLLTEPFANCVCDGRFCKLSKRIWNLKDRKINFEIKWRKMKQASWSWTLKWALKRALKCLNWLPLAGRRLSHRCTAVENAIKGDMPQHFESFKSTLRSSHGYNTRHGWLLT